MEPDFSGYATKANLLCSDGRTILANAFQHQDGATVPLVWTHGHESPENVLGHVELENRPDGVYAYGFFNETPAGISSKQLVQHGDINALSIWANKLAENEKRVSHGMIREVSLVMAGANPGAKIDFVNLAHSDGSFEELEDEAIIYTGLSLVHAETDTKEKTVADEEKTVKDVIDAMTEEQKNVLYYMIGAALEDGDDSAEHSEDNDNTDNTDSLTHEEGQMSRNVFDQDGTAVEQGHVLSHSDVQGIVADAIRGGSLKDAVESYALAHGIDNIDILFPDAKAVADRPEFIKRRAEWVSAVINGTRKTPFSRIKSLTADLTHEEARAKGYIKGSMKKEEFFSVAKRETTPTTIYKKQKLDRDDILDITDFDVVAWLKQEMRIMLEEEVARAILIGDGREIDDEDKIPESKIRPIATDQDLYVTTLTLDFDSASATDIVDLVLMNRKHYKGTGTPTFYTTEDVLTKLLMARDTLGRRLYRTVDDLASELRVSSIVPVEPMEDISDLVGIMVNLDDYNVGTDRGGEVSMFDDFDIDYNQYKYLMETRFSGALVRVKSAIVIRKAETGDTEVTPDEPTVANNVITIPTVTGVTYTEDGAPVTGTVTLTEENDPVVIKATADTGYYFSSSADTTWTFNYQA